MTLSVEEENNRFRVKWQGNSTDWLPDTISNRKSILVFLRLLQDENGKPVFTYRQLSFLFGGNSRQATSGEAHYQEERLLEEMMASASCGDIGEKAGIQVPETEGMQVSDPTSIRNLVTPGILYLIHSQSTTIGGLVYGSVSSWNAIVCSWLLFWCA